MPRTHCAGPSDEPPANLEPPPTVSAASSLASFARSARSRALACSGPCITRLGLGGESRGSSWRPWLNCSLNFATTCRLSLAPSRSRASSATCARRCSSKRLSPTTSSPSICACTGAWRSRPWRFFCSSFCFASTPRVWWNSRIESNDMSCKGELAVPTAKAWCTPTFCDLPMRPDTYSPSSSSMKSLPMSMAKEGPARAARPLILRAPKRVSERQKVEGGCSLSSSGTF